MQLLFLGDSITDAGHHFTSDGLGNGFVRLLSQQLPGHAITNRGQDGFTVRRTAQMLAQDPGSCTPDLATLLVGINDVPLQLFAGQTLDDFASAYESVLKALASCKTVITAEPFLFDRPESYRAWHPLLLEESRIIRKLSESRGCLFLPLQKMFDDASSRYGTESLTTDGIHLTPSGNALLAKAWLSLAAPFL